MSKIFLSPSGKVLHGHVLDVARTPLERKLQEYDPQLYLRWNPHKLGGWGCWELRRRPENKSMVDYVTYKGQTIIRMEYLEYGDQCHLKYFPYLNYKILEWVGKTDTWKQSYKAKNFAADLEYREGVARQTVADKAQADLDYNIKQNRSLVRDMMNFVNEGGNPYLLADHWK